MGGLSVIYGQTGGFSGPVALGSLTAAQGFVINGNATFSRLGASAAGIGDVNGDGRDDLLVGMPGAIGPTSLQGVEGAAVVVFGQAGNIAGPLNGGALTAGQGVRFDGGAFYGYAGDQVGALGDINGDGRMDFIVGAPG